MKKRFKLLFIMLVTALTIVACDLGRSSAPEIKETPPKPKVKSCVGYLDDKYNIETARTFWQQENIADVRRCIEQKGVDVRDDLGNTPLHLAAAFSKVPMVITDLVNAKADIHAFTTDDYLTPLHFAARWNQNPNVTTVLIDAGANANARDNHGRIPLHHAAKYDQTPDVITALIKARPRVNTRDKDGFTPLHFAAANNKNPGVITALLDAGANARVRTKERKLAIDLISQDSPLRGTDAYQQLREARRN